MRSSQQLLRRLDKVLAWPAVLSIVLISLVLVARNVYPWLVLHVSFGGTG
jgi:hypothetical protein